MDHGLLNAELQNNWFSAKNQSNRVEISHFTDFLEDMLHGSKKKTYLSDFKKSMMLIAEKLNQNTNNKTIVMIDELRIDCIFKKSVIKCNAKNPMLAPIPPGALEHGSFAGRALVVASLLPGPTGTRIPQP